MIMDALKILANALRATREGVFTAHTGWGDEPPRIHIALDRFVKTYDRSVVTESPYTRHNNKLSVMLDGVEIYALEPKPNSRPDPDSDEADTRPVQL
jgi:hypothetical protein